MKKLPVLLLFCLSAIGLFAQNAVKKYVFIEHFTNSVCSICASKNPGFYSLIQQAQYADDVHHLAIHPQVPYPSCVFYQYNKTENNGLAEPHDIFGTPQVVLNGVKNTGSTLLSEAKLKTLIDQTSPVGFTVVETTSGNQRSATVKLTSYGTPPNGVFRLYAAVAEKKINLETPNKEKVHHDVFRDLLTPLSGQPVSLPAQGQTQTFNFTYDLTGLSATEAFLTVWVKDTVSKTVLNSGTRFDPAVSSAKETTAETLRLTPNPAAELTSARIEGDKAQKVEVFTLDGRLVTAPWEAEEERINLHTGALPKGVYLVKITGEKRIFAGKFAVQ